MFSVSKVEVLLRGTPLPGDHHCHFGACSVRGNERSLHSGWSSCRVVGIYFFVKGLTSRNGPAPHYGPAPVADRVRELSELGVSCNWPGKSHLRFCKQAFSPFMNHGCAWRLLGWDPCPDHVRALMALEKGREQLHKLQGGWLVDHRCPKGHSVP